MSSQARLPRTASPATRQFFKALDRSSTSQTEISGKTGIHVNTFYGWKTGKAAATVFNMEAALSVLGLELVIRPISHPVSNEEPS